MHDIVQKNLIRHQNIVLETYIHIGRAQKGKHTQTHTHPHTYAHTHADTNTDACGYCENHVFWLEREPMPLDE